MSAKTPFRAQRSPSRAAALIAAAYAVAGMAWIYFSDRALEALPIGPHATALIGTAKGWIYVAVTAAILYAFMRRAIARERALAEELSVGEERYRTLVEESLAAIYIIQNGRFRYVNPRMEEMFGYSRRELLEARSVEDMVVPEDRELVRENLRRRLSGEIGRLAYSFRVTAKDGRRLELDVAGAVTVIDGKPAVIGTAVDQTERNRLQRESARAQKLEILGLLAGGIVHDVTNILNAIGGFAEMIRTHLPEGPSREDAGEIARCVDRAISLTRQFLAFGRGREAAAVPRELNDEVRSCEPMLRGAAGDAVVLELELEAGLGRVRAAPGEIAQVLLNLVVNARDALPAGGRVRVATRSASLPGGGGAGRPCAVLSVRDAGVGMDRATVERIFEPFFTTKAPGKGTGLGLPTVQRIAERGGGRVEVESAPGTGTTVRVSLPLV
jgi:PAS domain S-box-containing protein